MFENSSLKARIEDRTDGWLLGDSAYGLKKYMMTPKLNPSTPAEENYNEAHSKTRVVVERALGVCKSRFRCLHKSGGMLLFSPCKCVQIITAVMKPHNMCLEMRLPQDPDVDVQIPDQVLLPPNPARVDQTGQAVRLHLIQRFDN